MTTALASAPAFAPATAPAVGARVTVTSRHPDRTLRGRTGQVIAVDHPGRPFALYHLQISRRTTTAYASEIETT